MSPFLASSDTNFNIFLHILHFLNFMQLFLCILSGISYSYVLSLSLPNVSNQNQPFYNMLIHLIYVPFYYLVLPFRHKINYANLLDIFNLFKNKLNFSLCLSILLNNLLYYFIKYMILISS